MEELYDNHHVVPVSLGGEDLDLNIMRLKQGVHNNLHKILDIQPNIYSKQIRKIKLRSNHKIVKTEEEIEMRAELQRLFFDRLGHLPRWLQEEHVKKAMARFDYYRNIYNKVSNDEFDKPKRVANFVGQHTELHEKTISAQKEIAKVIQGMVQKIYLP